MIKKIVKELRLNEEDAKIKGIDDVLTGLAPIVFMGLYFIIVTLG